jgi:hypothetical protein
MKHFFRALVAAGLLSLAACGGSAEEENLAANAAGEDLYNIATEDLTLDNGLGNDLGVSLGNDSDAANLSESVNSAETNSSGNSQ